MCPEMAVLGCYRASSAIHAAEMSSRRSARCQPGAGCGLVSRVVSAERLLDEAAILPAGSRQIRAQPCE